MANAAAIKEQPMTLEEVRKKADIMVNLPVNSNIIDENGDIPAYPHETVIINGIVSQVRCGEPVAVSWPIYNALKESSRYRNVSILC